MRFGIFALVGASLLSGCATTYSRSASDWHRWRAYDYDRPDPTYHGYYADRYYRDDPSYTERVLTPDDRVYVGENGKYYCRRSDGTTGLIVGGIAGGVLGNLIAPGGAKTLGTLLGAGAGAAAGAAIDSNNVRCR